LKRGVYRTALTVDGRLFSAVTNIGTCPTYGERQKHAESYIIGFSGDLYGKDIVIKFLDYLREEKRFDNEKELIMQINIDKDRALRLYGEEK
jgi:riboflavin kinase/FMN adenylyltransferase